MGLSSEMEDALCWDVECSFIEGAHVWLVLVWLFIPSPHKAVFQGFLDSERK